MRKNIAWTERIENRVKREVRVSSFGNKLKWQYKRSDEDAWDYDTPPTAHDWNSLVEHAEAGYRRNRIPRKIIDLIKKNMPQGGAPQQ